MLKLRKDVAVTADDFARLQSLRYLISDYPFPFAEAGVDNKRQRLPIPDSRVRPKYRRPRDLYYVCIRD